MKYTLVITKGTNMATSSLLFETLEEARQALREKVRLPIKEYIAQFDPTPALVIQQVGKKTLYSRQLPYDIVRGEDYVALIIKENHEFIIGGAIAETEKIAQMITDKSPYAHVKYLDEDED